VETESGAPRGRRVRAKIADIAEELGILSDEVKSYLDLETGELMTQTSEIQSALEAIHDALPEELWEGSEEERRAAFAEAVKEAYSDNWMAEALDEADLVDRGIGERYIALPESDTQADYGDMEAFIETVSIPRLQDRLDRAIRGRGAFRRFRDELRDNPSEEQRWYAFKHEELCERVRRWLVHEHIELIEDGD
jgi:hypothetical protein